MARKAAAAEVLRDEVRLALVVAPVVDGEDMRVVQGRGRLRFGAEPAEKGLVVGQRLVQQLGGHAPPKARVVGEVHQCRRSRSDRCDQPVAPAQHPTDLVGHPRDDHSMRVDRRAPGAGPLKGGRWG